jgi:hypothetical protein
LALPKPKLVAGCARGRRPADLPAPARSALSTTRSGFSSACPPLCPCRPARPTAGSGLPSSVSPLCLASGSCAVSVQSGCSLKETAAGVLRDQSSSLKKVLARPTRPASAQVWGEWGSRDPACGRCVRAATAAGRTSTARPPLQPPRPAPEHTLWPLSAPAARAPELQLQPRLLHRHLFRLFLWPPAPSRMMCFRMWLRSQTHLRASCLLLPRQRSQLLRCLPTGGPTLPLQEDMCNAVLRPSLRPCRTWRRPFCQLPQPPLLR